MQQHHSASSKLRRMRSTALRALLILLSSCLVACGGTVPIPMVQVPLFRRQGQGEAGMVFGPGSRRPEIGGGFRYAATDTLRVGASISGARGPAPTRISDPRDQAPRLFADGFVGAEWGGLVMRFGAMAGSGYGLRTTQTSQCAVDDAEMNVACVSRSRATSDRGFVRSYGQLHLAFAPPGPLAASLAVRVPVVVELPNDAAQRSTELGTEVAFTQTILLPHLRLDLQPLWSRTRGFAFHLGLLFRFDTRS